MSQGETVLGHADAQGPEAHRATDPIELARFGVFPRLRSRVGAAVFPRGLPTRGARRVEQVPLAEALTHRWDDDRHLVLYTSSRPFRVNNAAVGKVRAEMRLLVFDVDHHDDQDDVARWMEGERWKIEALLAAHPGGFAHTTKRGWRMLYALPQPVPIRSEADKEAYALYYARVAAYVYDAFGVILDPALTVWNQPVRLPHVVREGRVFDAEILGGDARQLGAFALPEDAASMPDLRELTRVLPRWGGIAKRWEPKRAVFRIVSGSAFDGVPLPPYPERVASGETWVREQAPRAIQGQGGRATARSVAAMLHVGFAIERQDVERILTGVYNRRRCAPPWSEHELDDLRGIARGVARDPVRPWGFLLTRDRTGIEAARAMLAASAEAHNGVPLEEIASRIAATVQEHRTVVVRATYGAGKTHAMAHYIARQTTGRVIVVVPRHELGRAWVEGLRAAGEGDVAYHASVVQRRDDAGTRHCDNRIALKLYARGGDVARDVCPSCPRVASCPAYAERPNMGARVHVLPREMLPKLGVVDEDLVVFDDAAIDLLAWHRLTLRQLQRLSVADPRMLPVEQGRAVSALVEALLAGPRRSEELARIALGPLPVPAGGALRVLAAQAAEGQRAPHMPADLLAVEGDELAATLGDVRALRDVLRFAAATAAGAEVNWSPDTRSVHGESPAAALLRSHGGRLVVLDGAANVEELRALRADLHVERMDVADAGKNTARKLLFAKNATRSALKEPAKRQARCDQWLGSVLAHLTERRVRSPVIVTYKSLVPDLQRHPALQAWLAGDEGRQVRFAHYGGIRGSNRFQRADAVVTLGDPWLHGEDVLGRADWLDLDEPSYRIALATSELGQAHGRLRSVRRRRRLTNVHVGRLVPDGWGAGVDVSPLDGPPERTRGVADRTEFNALVGALGGNRQAAKVLGCSSSAVAQWRVGTRSLPMRVLEQARQECSSRDHRTVSSDVPRGGGAAADVGARMDTLAYKDLIGPRVHEPRSGPEARVLGAPTDDTIGASPLATLALSSETLIPPSPVASKCNRDQSVRGGDGAGEAPSPRLALASSMSSPLPCRGEDGCLDGGQVPAVASSAEEPSRRARAGPSTAEVVAQAAFVARLLAVLGPGEGRTVPGAGARASPDGFDAEQMDAALAAQARARRRLGS